MMTRLVYVVNSVRNDSGLSDCLSPDHHVNAEHRLNQTPLGVLPPVEPLVLTTPWVGLSPGMVYMC